MDRSLLEFARPISLQLPRRLTPLSAWKEHIPFAFNLVAVLRPRVIVELGTHAGDSYCAMCQAVEAERLTTRCYAVDTWEGDEHTGRYGPEVLMDLRVHHDPLYGKFSRLVQSTFHEALDHFSDGSVDLLHIDGLHTYDAVRSDFESWLPKMSASGVVLLHDVNVREQDFGVWKVWEELRSRYPHFEFVHGHGLGVLAVGDTPPLGLKPLLEAGEGDIAIIRTYFHEMGQRLLLKESLQGLAATVSELRATLSERDRRIGEMEGLVQSLQDRIRDGEAQLREQEARRNLVEAQVRERDLALERIRSSRAFALVTRYWRLRDSIAPTGTARRRVLSRLVGRRSEGAENPPGPPPSPRPMAALPAGAVVHERAGHCPVCDRDTRFTARDPWLRDHYRCDSCGSIPRERALMAVLRARFPEWRRLRIHESSPATAISRQLSSECPGYVATQYFPGVPGGAEKDGWRCEDLERQTFADASFDLVVTLDVMEHVLDWESAFREIGRTLVPGGSHLFTTPKYPGLRRSEVRARRGPNGIEYLAEPEYHGNPVDPKGALVTVHWGDDIGDIVLRSSGLTTVIHQAFDPVRGIEGEFLDVFVSTKPPS